MLSTVIVTKDDSVRLEKTLQSLRIQKGYLPQDWEIVIIDGGDIRSNHLVDQFPGLPIKLYKSTDSGIYDAMNNGIKLAQGEYLHFLNCGDLLFGDNVFKVTLEEMRRDLQNMYFWNFQVIGDKQTIKIDSPSVSSIVTYRSSYCHQAQIIRTSLLKKWEFDTDLKLTADFLTTLKIVDLGSTRCLNFIGVLYEPGGVSANAFTQIVHEKRRAFTKFLVHRHQLGQHTPLSELLQGYAWNVSPTLTKLLHFLAR